MRKEARYHLGYKIIKSCKIGEVEHVMGYNPDAATPYVCWYCKNGNYNFGYYCKRYLEARRKFKKRCRQERKNPKDMLYWELESFIHRG